MPALVNNNVGSFFTTMGADGTTVCCFDLKKSRNDCLISALFIICKMFVVLILVVYRPIIVHFCKPSSKGNKTALPFDKGLK